MSVERFRCPDCGTGVKADEDGCCAHCGADCVIVSVDPLRLVAGTVIEGLVAVFDKNGRWLTVTTMDDTTGWPEDDRLYRCRVTIEGEIG